jgi:protein SCO1/2
MRKNPNLFLVIAFTLIIPTTVFAIVKWAGRTWSALPVYNKRQPIPDFHLQNQDGRTVSLKDWKDKIVVVDFFFTHCPSICPKMTAGLREVQVASAGSDLLFNSFSVDPVRDSITQLKSFANRFNIQKNWNLLTGSKKEIYDLARKTFSVVASNGDGSEQDFIHSEKLVLVDRHQQIRSYYNGTDKKDIQQLINDIKKLSDEK